MKRYLMQLDDAFKKREIRDKETAPKLKILHATDSHILSVDNYINCRLLDRSQPNNERWPH